MKKFLAVGVFTLLVSTACTNLNDKSNVSVKQTALISDKLITSPNDDRDYLTMTLDNGIEVILVSDSSIEKSAAALSVGVGMLQDPMMQQGMAHYLEHMLFLGTERFPQTNGYSDFMSENGGAHNAYTWLDITNYMFKVNNDAYDEALERFSDFFKAPKLYPEYIDKERNAVNAEWSMRKESDYSGQYKLARNMLGEHPANRFIIGNTQTLSDKKDSNLHKETVDFYNRYYSANIMKVAMISNESLAEMASKANKHFSTIKNKNIAKPEVNTKIDFTKLAKKRVHYKSNEDVKQLKIDFTIENNQDQFAVKPNYFITYLISNEMQGSPAQVLKKQGLISQLAAYSSVDVYGNYGTLLVDIELTDKGMKNRETVVATVMQYINLIKREGIDSKYFDEIRTSLNNQFLFLEKGDEFRYVSNLAGSMQDYPINHAINAPYYYAKFDKEAIERVLEQLTSEHLRVWYISKDEPTDSALHFYDGQYKITDITEQEIESWKIPSQFALELPSVNKLLPEQFAIKTTPEQASKGVQKVFDEPGLTIWHAPSERFMHQPKGNLDIYINSPEPMTNIKADVALSVWSDLFAIAQSRLQTEANVAGMSLRLSQNIGLVLNVSGFTDKQPQLLSQAMQNLKLSVTQEEFEQALDRYRRAIINQGQQRPMNQVFGKYSSLVKSGSYDPNLLLKTAQNLSLNEFNIIQNQLLKQNQVRVFGFGNYSQSDLEAVAKVIKQALPNRLRVTEYTKVKYWQPKEGETFVWQEDIDMADVALIDVLVHPKPGFIQKAAARVLVRHLRNHIFDTLRTQEQLAYMVGATSASIDEYSALAIYIQTPVEDVQSMQQRFDSYKKEYGKVLAALDNETFLQLKNASIVSLKETPKNLSDEISPLINDWYKENFDYDSKDKLVAALEEVTIADVKAFYQQTMLNDNASRLNVQMRGHKFKNKPFAQLPNQTKLSSIEDFYRRIAYQH
ncbi:Protease 3 [Pseudoalteromonas holothuriae]|uniref:Protease 3 n=1 Tax=Pseudoalteromonas holothuriae TaxID=2963714 RepID=A0ABM9GDR8_9GAMM|nr:insulinase family protein [Pseudoalteromonas sp. CIP111951]CAH9050801.1 Protease 3 [Pseudoalteromonas sp. CIP111951]